MPSTDGPDVPTSAVNVTSNLSADIPLRRWLDMGGQHHPHLLRTVVTESHDRERGVSAYPDYRDGWFEALASYIPMIAPV